MFYIILGLIVVTVFATISIYNQLVSFRNLVKNSFSQIDVQLKRRYDLIPNLVETAKAYMAHERETLEAVIKARNQAFDAEKILSQNPSIAKNMDSFKAAENHLSNSLSKLMMVMEQYPDLKANTTMNSLMEELTSTENKISFARQAFNDSVMEYNTTREKFPHNLVSEFFKFTSAQSFEITNKQETENIQVKFS